jgi:RNA polymerase sigma-70 factor (ECF subfamily)
MNPLDVFDRRRVEQAQHGDPLARERLLGALESIVRAFFLKRVGGVPDLDDLIQNTLLRVHHSLNDLKDPERLKAFAMKAALFELQDFYRGRYRGKERLYDPEQPPETPPVFPDEAAHLDVERALARLSPKARRILELRTYGYPYEDIATLVGTTEAAIKMQVKRALEKLRTTLVSVLAFGLFVLLRYL